MNISRIGCKKFWLRKIQFFRKTLREFASFFDEIVFISHKLSWQDFWVFFNIFRKFQPFTKFWQIEITQNLQVLIAIAIKKSRRLIWNLLSPSAKDGEKLLTLVFWFIIFSLFLAKICFSARICICYEKTLFIRNKIVRIFATSKFL